MEDIKQKLYNWQGRMQEMHSRRETLYNNVVANRNFIQEKDIVLDFLEKLQKKEHEQAVGRFEKWLTSLLQEVFNVSDQRIVLDLHTDYSKVGLDILLEKNGELEDLYSGNGGAYTNLIATGLRLIATAITQRAFLVLDEPDCWIKSDILMNFFNVITRYSRELGIQVILISHHNLEGVADREFLLENNGKKTWISDIKDNFFDIEEEHEHIKIQNVHLKNFMQYEDVVFELSPFVNLFTGLNNIGKSGLVQGLRCVFYNEKPHTFIRHGKKETEILINFNTLQQIQYNAKETKSNKSVVWRLLDQNAPEDQKLSEESRNKDDPEHMILKTTGIKSFPKWIEKISSIGLVDNIDIQLGFQKKPSSILEGTPHERAMVLSLNKESSYAQKMMDEFKNQCRKAQESIKNGEEELTSIDQKLKADPFINQLTVLVEKMNKTNEDIKEKEESFKWGKEIKVNWQRSNNISNIPVLEKQNLPYLTDYTPWINLKENWSNTFLYINIPAIVLPENMIDSNLIRDLKYYTQQYVFWKKTQILSSIKIYEKIAPLPQLTDINDWKAILFNWKQLNSYKNINLEPINKPFNNIQDIIYYKNLLSKWQIDRINKELFVDLPQIVNQPLNLEKWEKILYDWRELKFSDIDINIPDIDNLSHIQPKNYWQNLLSHWKKNDNVYQEYYRNFCHIEKEKETEEKNILALEKKFGGICPLCHSKMKEGHSLTYSKNI